MKPFPKRTLALCAFVALALVVAACGSSNNNSSSSSTTSTGSTASLTGGHKGGSVDFLASADVDYIDPGQTYYTFGFTVEEAINRTLYSYKPNDSTTPVPDLATGPPEISADNKTLTVHIRKGVKYSPPVNREVKAADIKYAFERAFSKNVPSGYAGAYFQQIVGAPKAGTGPIKDISGITTPDDYTIVFKLKTPLAALVAQALVMPITVPVPKEYASKFDAKLPSTYDKYAVATGPYMVANNPTTGELTGRQPGKIIKLVRNPNWTGAAEGDYRPAYLDSITIDEGNSDLTVAARRTLKGSHLLCCDAGSPPAPVLKQAVQQDPSQLAFIPSGGTRYISLNNTLPPFNNINVRKAVIAGFDRNALRQARGGPLLGDIANGWLPPGLPGYTEAGGMSQGSSNDFLKSPTGDPAVFKAYMLKAKAQGVPVNADGTYAGKEKLLMVADNADPGKKMSENAEAQFQKMGFQINFRVVPHDTMYTKFCQVPKSKAIICPNVGWFKDFADPQAMLDATFNGNNILAVGNVNYQQFNDPAINAAMKKAGLIAPGAARNQAWAAIDKSVIAGAPAIPVIWDKTAIISSKDVQQVPNTYTTTADLNYSYVK